MPRQKGFHHSEKTKNKIRNSIKKIFETDPTYVSRISTKKQRKRFTNNAKNRWKDPLYREKMLKIFADENYRIKLSLARKKLWEDGKYENIRPKLKIYRMNLVLPTKDTTIEVKLQEGLKKLNIPFEKHKAIENFVQCDIFIEPNIVIFADGCYFHACPKCYPDRMKLSTIQNTVLIRDTLVNQFFSKNKKYKVLRFWQHDINSNFEDRVLDEIIFILNKKHGGLQFSRSD